MTNIRPLRYEGDLAFVTLTRGLEAVIDAADAHLVEGFNWFARVGGRAVYACRAEWRDGKQQTAVRMHRVIICPTREMQVDHIDGDGLNNRRANLRQASHSQNQRNRGLGRKNTSGYKGVSWHTSSGKWWARIWAGGKRETIGSFATPEAAHAAYVEAAIKLHGEFARTA